MIEAELPDGTILEFPEGTSNDIVQKAVKSRLGISSSPSFGQTLKQEIGNLGAGALRGAGSIGATLLTPLDAAARAMGVENSIIGRNDRREAMTGALQEMGAQPESLGFQAGKLAGEVAGTAGVPGALAKGAQALRFAPSVVQALQTGGMAGGSLPTRIGAGALTGGAMAGLANPQDAGTGAMIGGAIPAVAPIVSKGVELGRKMIGQTTGVGDEALRQAYLAGKQGGSQAEAFRTSMRGETSIDDVLASAKQNLQAMGAQRQQAYRSGMTNIKADKTVLDMKPIAQAADDALNMTMFKGQVKNPAAAEKLQAVKNEIGTWQSLDPAEFHTPEGLDALKQKVGDVLESIPFEQRQARMAVGNVYNAIKDQIKTQAPEYSNVMKDYSQASDLIKEIERSLSIGQKSAAETGMRKLQSLMRNNVNTAYGYRTQLAQALEQAGGQQLMPQLAGQALNEWTPRGIQRATSGTGSAALALTGNIPQAAGLAAISSPRLMGETMYGAGRVAGAVNPKLIEALKRGAVLTAPHMGGE